MLVLSRKSGERVLVGEDIEVVVLEVDGDRVKLGFAALDMCPSAGPKFIRNWQTVWPPVKARVLGNYSAERRQPS